jgi:poly(3-hydroxybutyrate) depolymerase
MTARSCIALAALSLLLTTLTGCERGGQIRAATAAQRNLDAFLQFGGLTRTYHIDLPASYDGAHALPLVLIVHGGGTGSGMIPLARMNSTAEA